MKEASGSSMFQKNNEIHEAFSSICPNRMGQSRIQRCGKN